MPKPGDRVGAILSGSEEGIKFLGYGTYVGDEVPEGAAGWMADGLREHAVKNPKIELDNGSIVWGCECWWGAEEAIKQRLEGATVIEVDINEVRKETETEE